MKKWEWEWEGMGIDSMGMGGSGNVKSHSRSSLVYTIGTDAVGTMWAIAPTAKLVGATPHRRLISDEFFCDSKMSQFLHTGVWLMQAS